MNRREMMKQAFVAAGIGAVVAETAAVVALEAVKSPFQERREAEDYPIELKPEEITAVDVHTNAVPLLSPSFV